MKVAKAAGLAIVAGTAGAVVLRHLLLRGEDADEASDDDLETPGMLLLEASRQLLVTLLTVSGSVLGLALQAMVTGTTSLSSVWGAG